MDKMRSILFINFLLPLMDHPDHFSRILFCKRGHRIKSFPVLRQTYRHNGHTFQHRQISRQIPDAPFQFLPIINPFAKYDLPIHLDSALIQDVHLFQCFPCKTIMEHFAAKLRVRRLKRNIDRFQSVPYDPLNILITHIRQCDIISL